MKNLILLFLILLSSFCGLSQQKDQSHDMEIQVDGRHFVTIPKEQNNNYTVSIPLQKGRHEIRWIIKSETNRSGPNAEISTFSEQVNIDPNESLAGNRIDVVNKIIEVGQNEKDSIRIDIYDNGVVDNDTISVYADNLPLVTDQKVSTKPIGFFISMKPGQQTKRIRMEARNLGLIPPNTSLMVITTKQNKYIINMTSDMLKNAAVDFVVKD
jgi:hypothetical protein